MQAHAYARQAIDNGNCIGIDSTSMCVQEGPRRGAHNRAHAHTTHLLSSPLLSAPLLSSSPSPLAAPLITKNPTRIQTRIHSLAAAINPSLSLHLLLVLTLVPVARAVSRAVSCRAALLLLLLCARFSLLCSSSPHDAQCAAHGCHARAFTPVI